MKSIMTLVIPALLLQASAEAACTKWTSKKVGTLDTQVIDEASGLTASKTKPGKFIWSNDSGGSSELYATDITGKVERRVSLSGFQNTDFEAVETGPCPSSASESCIYVGDIGDGIGWRSSFKMGIFKESDFWTNTTIKPVKAMNFSYPGSAENAEGMVVLKDGTVVIFSKDQSGITNIYSLNSSGKVTKINEVNLNKFIEPARGKGPRVTDADLSFDGSKVLLLTYGDIAEISTDLLIKPSRTEWKKGVDFNVIKGTDLTQQETIAYLADGSFIVSSEAADGITPAVVQYTCSSR